ncbi:hypothetical protein LWI29_030259 [Acer saccharum]|uniref:Flavin-containing monooxygenase n=1 Tax=Acer saccharum TaxID=4024 RepID=A0AA39S3K5_ACESA|nr:hypothetical protein LWI29_030259 [Acer saccharum]
MISRYVAVIGAGAAGLVAARELRREGHAVVVFEREDQVGGTWVYTQEVDSDPLGLDPSRVSAHSSLCSSLRTNLPRESMGFIDYPFVTRSDGSGDPRRFPGHKEVLRYLKEFARVFGVEEMVRFEVEVVKVCLVENNRWKVRSKKTSTDGDIIVEEVFDAVVVCSGGRYSQPHVADIPGINVWPGKQMHSHNFRIPEPFRDQVAILVGNSFSAADISRDMARVVKEVHVASKFVADGTYEKQPGYDNMWLRSKIESAHEDGTVVFRNGRVVFADVILHCTGPSLFPFYELQSKWIAGVLSGRIMLPSQQEMMEDVKAFYSTLEASGKPKRYTHAMNDYQFEYNYWLAAQSQCRGPGFAEWRDQMMLANVKNRSIRPDTFRDEWEDEHLILEAQEEFINYTSYGASDMHL